MSEEFLLRLGLESGRKLLIDKLEQLRPVDERREGSHSESGEEATETFELEKHLALEKRLRDHLAEVEHALDKLDQGTYGVCDNCGHPIDPARLEALPQANLCLNCKAHEASRKRQGDSRRKNSAYEESKAYPPYSVDALLDYHEQVWEDEPKEG